MDAEMPRLTAAQTAARLGVQSQTLYAYVSRGLLARERGAHGSTFDALEVERFASSRRRGGRSAWADRGADAGASGSPLMVLDTDIALIEDGELYLRGVPAAQLALEYPYESVARWLWGGPFDASAPPRAPSGLGVVSAPAPASAPESAPDEDAVVSVRAATTQAFTGDEDAVASARGAVASLGSGATLLDLIQVAVPVLAAADPTRHDLNPDAVCAAAARLIGGVVATLDPALHPTPPVTTTDAIVIEKAKSALVDTEQLHFVTSRAADARVESQGGIARQLWRGLSGRAGDTAEVRALGAALVLLIDHDLAVSTLAARAAASARATPYAVVSSGLGALDSALHGNASGAACELIRLVLDGADPRTALAQTVARTARPAPGFGHALYPGIDARAGILLPLVAELPDGCAVVVAVDRLSAEVLSRTGRHPNVDLALAALTIAAGMPTDAGAAIFAIGRMAGWIAHAIDEYGQRPLRLRPRGRYVGPDAGTPANARSPAVE
ncbi:citrate synthase [Humibacter antri]